MFDKMAFCQQNGIKNKGMFEKYSEFQEYLFLSGINFYVTLHFFISTKSTIFGF